MIIDFGRNIAAPRTLLVEPYPNRSRLSDSDAVCYTTIGVQRRLENRTILKQGFLHP